MVSDCALAGAREAYSSNTPTQLYVQAGARGHESGAEGCGTTLHAGLLINAVGLNMSRRS